MVLFDWLEELLVGAAKKGLAAEKCLNCKSPNDWYLPEHRSTVPKLSK